MGAPTPQFRRGTIGSNAAAQQMSAEHNTTPTQPALGEKPVRTNKYAAPCVTCGVRVEAEQGRLEKNNGKWEVSHIPPCPEVSPAAAESSAPVEPEFQPNVVNGETLYDGIYTFETLVGHRTFRLHTQGLDKEFMPGVQIIQHLVGPDNETDYVGFGHIKGGRLSIWKRHQDNKSLVADAQGFMEDPNGSNVVKSVNCYRCGRTLTVPASVYNGLGPECAKKGL